MRRFVLVFLVQSVAVTDLEWHGEKNVSVSPLDPRFSRDEFTFALACVKQFVMKQFSLQNLQEYLSVKGVPST